MRHHMHLHDLLENLPMRAFQVASPNFTDMCENWKHQSLNRWDLSSQWNVNWISKSRHSQGFLKYWIPEGAMSVECPSPGINEAFSNNDYQKPVECEEHWTLAYGYCNSASSSHWRILKRMRVQTGPFGNQNLHLNSINVVPRENSIQQAAKGVDCKEST